jgi:hypothetical protein
MRKYFTLAISAIIFLAAVPALAQEKEPEIPPQRYEVSVRLVLVDVTALDRDGRFDSTLAQRISRFSKTEKESPSSRQN